MSPLFPVLLVAVVMGTALHQDAEKSPAYTVDGPEEKHLVKNVRGYLVLQQRGMTGWGIRAVSLPDLKERTVLPVRESMQVYSLTGPDRDGRIGFIQRQLRPDRFSLRTIRLDGKEEKIFSRPGDPIWDNVIGESLALAPQGGRVAFVRDPKSVRPDGCPFLIEVGPLEVWDLAKKTGRDAGVRAVDRSSSLSWFPDGERLAYVELLPRKAVEPMPAWLGNFGAGFQKWDRVPAVHVLHVPSGKKSFLHVGFRAVVSSDGKSILVTDAEDDHWRLVDVGSGKSKAVWWPGNWPLALVDGKLVIYLGLPTTGTPVRLAEPASPIARRRLMLSLKVAELDSGKFQTLVNDIDPRHSVSFGMTREQK